MYRMQFKKNFWTKRSRFKLVFVSFQREDGEKNVVYNTMGPNICMGDHKVTV